MPNNFFQDEKGSYSLLRLQSFLGLVFSFCLGLYSILETPGTAKELSITFLAVSVGGKCWQKSIETSQKNTTQ